jgi:hypothetical protein
MSQLLYIDGLLLTESLKCATTAPSVPISHYSAMSAVECYKAFMFGTPAPGILKHDILFSYRQTLS